MEDPGKQAKDEVGSYYREEKWQAVKASTGLDSMTCTKSELVVSTLKR